MGGAHDYVENGDGDDVISGGCSNIERWMLGFCVKERLIKIMAISEGTVLRSLVRNGERSGSRGAVVLEGESI